MRGREVKKFFLEMKGIDFAGRITYETAQITEE